MDSDKSSNGDSGYGPGWRQRSGQPDSPGEHRDPRFSSFEQDCLDELELDSAEDEASSTGTRSDGGTGNPKDDFIDTCNSEQSSHRLWLAFQHTASSISQLYRDHCAATGTTWYSFRTAAEACTEMYKESQDVLRMSVEEARREGRKQLVKDLVMWMKKRGRRGRHFRREELLAFLSGKTPPPLPSRPSTTTTSGYSSSQGVTSVMMVGQPSHHSRHKSYSHCHPSADGGGGGSQTHRRSLTSSASMTDVPHWSSGETCDDTTSNANNNNDRMLFLEPDLRTFRDALAVQGLSGALSNIRVAGSPHSSHGGTTPPIGAGSGGASPLRHSDHRIRPTTPSGRQTPNLRNDDLHQFISDHMTLHGALAGENRDPLTHRKRSSSQSGGQYQRQDHDGHYPTADSPTRKRHRLL